VSAALCLAEPKTDAPDAPDAEEARNLPVWTGKWAPPPPDRNGWDWIRLSSDEWVKGEILLMRNFELQFDSDEFGVVEIDWEDVAEIFAERVYTVVLEDIRTAYTGTMIIRGRQVRVATLDGTASFDRSKIAAIVPDTSKETNLWSVRASAGVAYQSGNTESADLNGKFKIDREGQRTTTRFEYSGVYGSVDEVKNTNTHRGLASLDYFLSRDFFLVPAQFQVFTDEFQNISYRLTPTMGVGYYVLRWPKIEWQVRTGLGYQYTRRDSAPAGDTKTSDNGAVLFATTIDTDVTSRLDLIIDYQLQVIAPDTGLTNHHTDVTFEFEVTSAIDFDIGFVWNRVENPERQADGTRPDRDDFRLNAGIAIEY
jgi:putative salt-induced outer membrane protein YdiY